MIVSPPRGTGPPDESSPYCDLIAYNQFAIKGTSNTTVTYSDGLKETVHPKIKCRLPIKILEISAAEMRVNE